MAVCVFVLALCWTSSLFDNWAQLQLSNWIRRCCNNTKKGRIFLSAFIKSYDCNKTIFLNDCFRFIFMSQNGFADLHTGSFYCLKSKFNFSYCQCG